MEMIRQNGRNSENVSIDEAKPWKCTNSDASSAVTGEIHHADSGFNMGTPAAEFDEDGAETQKII